jgi:hypothetical protein
MSTHGGEGPNAGVVRKISNLPGVGDRAAGPIDAVGKRRQKAKQEFGFGRAGAICEQDIIMQILPGSSDNAVLINASSRFCNIGAAKVLWPFGNPRLVGHSELSGGAFRVVEVDRSHVYFFHNNGRIGAGLEHLGIIFVACSFLDLPSHGKHVHRIGKPARREWAPSGLAHTADTTALNAFSANWRLASGSTTGCRLIMRMILSQMHAAFEDHAG